MNDSALETMLARQEAQIAAMNARLDRYVRQGDRRGGFPFSLLLLAGLGYYVYRTPSLRNRVTDLVQNLNPGVKGNLERAGNAAREGLEAVRSGQSPSEALQDLRGELTRGAQKAVQNAQDTVKDAAQDAKQAAKTRSGNP